MSSIPSAEKVRLDKWLWAARFFKTRSLAAEAVGGGKVHVNQARAKPARAVHIGDVLTIRRGPEEFVVVVRGLSARRGPAREAATLYDETAESLARRETLAESRRLQAPLGPRPAHRPSKKDRRRIVRFTRGDD